MNVFIVPSWYPSATEPHAGIFNKEQAEALAHVFPDSRFALSTWGSHDEDLLLWGREPFKNLLKIARFPVKKGSCRHISRNLTEYYNPVFTWSRKFLQGNIQHICKVNEKHFLSFQAKVGTIDVIHAHSAYPAGWVAMKLSKKYSLPYIITEQMSPFPFQSFLSGKGQLSTYLQKPFSYAACNIVVSDQQKEKLAARRIPKLKTIPNVTNEHFFKPAARKAGPFTFFTLGRMEDQKGIPYLLEAFKLFTKEQQGCFLRIGGGGSEKEAYQALASRLGIADKVEWLDVLNRSQALEEYQQCNAFVLPSLHENLPLVLLEALACGRPLIGTRCGGPESIIKPTNGLLVEPGDTQALYKALLFMYGNYQQYNQDEIRKDFCGRYSRQVVCRQLMEVYQSTILNR